MRLCLLQLTIIDHRFSWMVNDGSKSCTTQLLKMSNHCFSIFNQLIKQLVVCLTGQLTCIICITAYQRSIRLDRHYQLPAGAFYSLSGHSPATGALNARSEAVPTALPIGR